MPTSLFRLKPGEGRLTLLTTLLSFCTGFSIIFLYAASRALFLTHYDARDLAYVYLGVAPALIVAGVLYTRIERLVSQQRLVGVTFGFLILSLTGFRYWFAAGNPALSAMGLAVWFDVCFLLINLSFWGLCGRIFHIQQAKRLYGLVGSGHFLAVLMVGFLIPFFVGRLGAVNLLLFSCLGLTAAFVMTTVIQRYSDRHLPLPKKEKNSPKDFNARGLFKNPYLTILHLAWALSVAAIFLADTALSSQAEISFLDPDALAGFFGLFYAATAAVVLMVRAVAAGRLIDKLGVVSALYLVPGALALIAGALALSAFFPHTGPLIFWLAIGLRFFDYILDYSFYKPAFMVFYQPLKPHQRVAAQTTVESLARSAAIFVIGCLLLLGARFFTIDAVNISYILLVLVAVWFASIPKIRRQYTRVLMDAMKKNIFKSSNTAFKDKLSLSIIAKRLESPNPDEVIFCVNLLDAHAPETLEPILMGLLFHPADIVVLDSLARVERIRPAYALEDIQDVLENSKNPNIIAAALKAYVAVGEAEVIDATAPFLDHPDPKIMIGAMVGLIRYAGIEGVLTAGRKLLDLKSSPREADRLVAAHVLKETGIRDFYRPLADLLRDDSMGVRRVALAAAEKIQNPRLMPALISNLAVPEIKGQTVGAISAMGSAVIPDLTQTFSQPQHKRVRAGIIKILSRIPDERATQFLVDHLFYPETAIRLQVLSALQIRGYQATGEEGHRIKEQVRMEAASAAWFLNALAELDNKMPLMKAALMDELTGITNRILSLISFICPSGLIREAQKNLNHLQPEKQAYALETLDNLLPKDLKKAVFPLLAPMPLSQRLDRMVSIFPQERLTPAQRLAAMVRRDQSQVGGWTRIVAVYNMGLQKGREFLAPLQMIRAEKDPLLSETGAWALSQVKEKNPEHGSQESECNGQNYK